MRDNEDLKVPTVLLIHPRPMNKKAMKMQSSDPAPAFNSGTDLPQSYIFAQQVPYDKSTNAANPTHS